MATEEKIHCGWAVGSVTEHTGDEEKELVSLVVFGEGAVLISPADARRIAKSLIEHADAAEAING